MSAPVEAAIIAGCFGIVTVIVTVITQVRGFRSTRANTEQQIRANQKATADTLEHQRQQLDRTLAEQRTQTRNERFATAADQLGSDKPAIRLAGVYAMAGLADDWEASRQTCVDVLCAYLRMPYEPDPGDEAPEPEQFAFRASREVRHTVIRVITAHLQSDDSRAATAQDWRGLNFDFTGTVFDGGTFGGAQFPSGLVSFIGAVFSGGGISFANAQFSGATVSFDGAVFSGGMISFHRAKFSGSNVLIRNTRFSGSSVFFGSAEFSGGAVSFEQAEFSSSKVIFRTAEFSGTRILFNNAEFTGGRVSFGVASFSGGDVSFFDTRFHGGDVDFGSARFSGGKVDFSYASFSGGKVNFHDVKFSGGEVDFSNPADWSFPPRFPWTDTPPKGVILPKEEDQP